MGTPLPRSDPGNLCSICWGPSKTFGDVDTPRQVTATIVGLLEGEFWNPITGPRLLLPTVLTQTIVPCNFMFNDGVFEWTLRWSVIRSEFFVRQVPPSRQVFRNGVDPPCDVFMVNVVTTFSGNFSYRGNVTIDWFKEGS